MKTILSLAAVYEALIKPGSADIYSSTLPPTPLYGEISAGTRLF